MPTLDVSKKYLESLLIGETIEDEKFEEICFEYGVELDKIEIDEVSKEKILKIDIPPNRSDLLCAEGLATSLNQYLQLIPPVEYKFAKATEDENLTIHIDDSIKTIRPYVASAVLKNVTFTDASFKSFIDYQEKLHCTLARDRSLSSIGTHDLDNIKGPFVYKAMKPEDINFHALKQTKEMNALELFEELKKDSHLKKYLKIIDKFDKFPVIVDSNLKVLSLPPIINGMASKMSAQTRNVLIEVTGTDLLRVNSTIRCFISAFSYYCDNKYSFVPVKITNCKSCSDSFLSYTDQSYKLNIDYISSAVGFEIDLDSALKSLNKMGISCKIEDDYLVSSVPLNRTDILHEIDLIEDIAIGYGINSIDYTVPKLVCTGSLQKLSKVTNLLRHELSQNNLIEALTFSLCSRNDISTSFNEPWDLRCKNIAVTIDNPKTFDFQVVRTTLLPGLMKTIASNQHVKLPISIYEISDVVRQCNESQVGAKNSCNMAILIADKTTKFENLHGILDRIMAAINVKFDKKSGYSLSPNNDLIYLNQAFIKEMSAQILYREATVGILGILMPTVLEKYGINYPCIALEIEIEKLLKLIDVL